jgi:hypothetical protein
MEVVCVIRVQYFSTLLWLSQSEVFLHLLGAKLMYFYLFL